MPLNGGEKGEFPFWEIDGANLSSLGLLKIHRHWLGTYSHLERAD